MTQDQSTASFDRRPRIALMGEFSAGKSTLANLLLGRNASPVQVTATQLPPVWYEFGDEAAARVTATGTREPLPLDDWSEATPDNTRMISAQLSADFLYACDLIDMPGTSDPCMVPDFWEQFLPLVDFAIWCTPANQAWRQSEAAMWEQVPEEIRANSLLLITRIDKMQTAQDRARVVQRVRGEVGDMFCDILPIALPDAIAGRDNDAVLERSGAADLVGFLEKVLERLVLKPKPEFEVDTSLVKMPKPTQAPCPEPGQSASAANCGKVIPRRVIRDRPSCRAAS